MKYCTMWPLDVHGSIAAVAAATASAGLLFAFNAYTVVAAYCMVMYAIYPTLIVHEVACLLLAGFVFQAARSTTATCIYAVAYALFLTAIPMPRLEQQTPAKTTAPAAAPPPIEGNDI